MLIRYNVTNFLSFNDEVEFSMIANSERRLKEHYIEAKDINILKTGIIYGANAAGKSNLVKSIAFARSLLLIGTERIETIKKHCRIVPENVTKPSIFEFELKCCERFYAYGFAIHLTTKKVEQEWLSEIGTNKKKLIFERYLGAKDEIIVNYGIKFANKDDKFRFDLYAQDLKHEHLLLSQINGRNFEGVKNVEAFRNVFNWFKETLTIIFPTSRYIGGLTFIGNDKEMTESFNNFLSIFKTGISSIEMIETDFEEEFKKVPNEVRVDITKDLRLGKININNIGRVQYQVYLDEEQNVKASKLGLIHKDIQGNNMVFDLDEESDGTQRLFDLIPALHALAKRSKVIIVDELDRSLHPLLTKGILELFIKNTVGTESQLIFTTHESGILDLKILRRDEIWFIDREKENKPSVIHSLDEFKVRYDKEIRKDYLIGRYGAIPLFVDLANLTWLQYGNKK